MIDSKQTFYALAVSNKLTRRSVRVTRRSVKVQSSETVYLEALNIVTGHSTRVRFAPDHTSVCILNADRRVYVQYDIGEDGYPTSFDAALAEIVEHLSDDLMLGAGI